MKFKIIFCSLLLLAFHNANAINYFHRHYIVLVDQTTSSMNEDPEGLREIGKMISNIFLNRNINEGVNSLKINATETYSANLKFDPETDEISVFKFGTNSDREDIDSQDYGLNRIRKNVKNHTKDELSALTDELIIPVAQFQKTGNDISSFVKKYLTPLFYGDGFGGVNMSSIVYPCVLKKVETNPAAIEYYIIIVSNFKVRGEQENRDDYGLIRTAMNQDSEYATNFATQLWQLHAPFYTSELMKIQSLQDRNDIGNSMTRIKAVKAVCYQLGLKSLQGVSSYITSNMILHETSVGATTYDLESVNISFNKDNQLNVDSLVMKVLSSTQECLYSENVLERSNYDETGTKSYNVSPIQMDLGRVFDVGEVLTFQYLFFTTANDEKGNAILPIVFSAERNYEITTETLESPEEQKKLMIIYTLILLLLLLCLALFAYYIWKNRGSTRKASVNFTIWPISHDRFMEVKDKKVNSFDCWYWRQGDTDMNIPITGRLNLEEKRFAKMFKYKIETQIQDIDDNMDFSFRPDPVQFRNNHGDDPKANEWYEVPVNSDGTFSFSANAYIESGLRPNFNRENILKMKVTLRCVMKGDGDDKYVDQNEHSYTFTVRPEIDNRNIWIAFDPGTTGSCVAYGASSNPTDTDDIYLAENEYDTLNDGSGRSHIYPSMIRLNHKSQNIFNDNIDSTMLLEGDENDFLFGNEASIMWDEEGVNCFQSIKKLLGYTDTYKIVSQDGKVKEMSGQDIAHLLVKGLYNHIQSFVENDQNVNESIREMFISNGVFTPQRAIVAVPNNYTMVKIQEMVDTVKRTRKFKEVHFIYEAEAVMMMYFRKSWKNLPNLQDKIFVVYDMGGATINATAFKIKVIMGQKNGNSFIRRIEVNTISKIGYGVGGDDIDFALIQILYSIPSVSNYLSAKEINVKLHQQENKVKLIDFVRDLKLELIAKNYHEDSAISHLDNVETLYGYIRDTFMDMGVNISPIMTDKDVSCLEKVIDIEELKHNEYLKKYVYDNVEDAINNLFSSIDEDGDDVELVMSGRSVLFPGVEKLVETTIEKNGYDCNRWTGFDNQKGYLSSEKVKVAVATGACWYAMYSDYIKLRNNKITSSFGYIDMINHKQQYVPVIRRNEEFNEDHYIERALNTQSNLADVKFLQMLGAASEYNGILKNDIKYKYNILDEVRPAEIRTSAETIYIRLDDCGNFSYKIKIQGKGSKDPDLFKVTDNKFSRLSKNVVKTEIVNENSESYIFSTLNLMKSGKGVVERFMSRINRTQQQSDNIRNSGRF